MIEKNIVCIESSLSIDRIIDDFIQEEMREKIIPFNDNKKEDTSDDSILLYDNFMNQLLPKELLNSGHIIIVRVTNFNEWKGISQSETTEKINSLFKKGEVSLFANAN